MRGEILDNYLTVDNYLYMKTCNMTDLDIALDFDYGVETLRRWKRLKGINNHDIAKAKYNRIIRLLNNDHNKEKVGYIMHTHPRTITNILKKFT